MKREVFESFMSENEQRIYNYLQRFVDGEDDALDLTQSVFLAFYRKLPEIEEKTALAYLYRISHNMAINFLKHHKRTIVRSPDDFANLSAPPNPVEPDYSILNNVLKELPPKLSAVIHLQYYEKLSGKQISAKLNISVKAVESLLVRAKKLLRKKIMQGKGETNVLQNR